MSAVVRFLGSTLLNAATLLRPRSSASGKRASELQPLIEITLVRFVFVLPGRGFAKEKR